MSEHLRLDIDETEEAEVLPPGTLLQERYRILEVIGQGGMGTVYKAEHLILKKPVAIKCLVREFARDKKTMRRFLQEARAASAVGHEHIIDVVDFGSLESGDVFMVTELLSGQDLGQWLEEQTQVDIDVAAHILCQVCSALYAAHEAGIIHRDLKPGNIFLSPRRTDPYFVKVLDFGLAKLVDTSQPSSVATRKGTIMGTPLFMAPEQFTGDSKPDHHVDIYALGVTLFHMLTGEYPFNDEALSVLMMSICNKQAPRLSAYRDDIPDALDTLCATMLAKNPSERFDSCKEVWRILRPFAETTRQALYKRSSSPDGESLDSPNDTSATPSANDAQDISIVVTHNASLAQDDDAPDKRTEPQVQPPIAVDAPPGEHAPHRAQPDEASLPTPSLLAAQGAVGKGSTLMMDLEGQAPGATPEHNKRATGVAPTLRMDAPSASSVSPPPLERTSRIPATPQAPTSAGSNMSWLSKAAILLGTTGVLSMMACVVLITAFVLWNHQSDPDPPPMQASAPAATAPPTPAAEARPAASAPTETQSAAVQSAAAQSAAAQPAAEETRVQPARAVQRTPIEVTTDPATASLFLDDEPVDNPFSGQLSSDQHPTFRAELTGYRSETLQLHADVGGTHTITLSPLAPPQPQVTPRRAPRQRTARPRPSTRRPSPRRTAPRRRPSARSPGGPEGTLQVDL